MEKKEKTPAKAETVAMHEKFRCNEFGCIKVIA